MLFRSSGGPGYNNFYVDSRNARGGSGKALTFYDESCVNYFEDSDGNVGKDLGTVYNEIYIRFYIRFQQNYRWGTAASDAPQHKLMHVQYHYGSGTPWSYFGNDANKPLAVPGLKYYQGNVWYYVNYRCEEDYYCQGSPKYSFDVTGDHDHINLGPWTTVLGDNQWHLMEFYFKMNTNTGSVFNADGIHRFWLDGNLKFEATNIPWSDNGSTQSPRRGWNYVSWGGNNNNRWTTSCSGTSCEQWYAVDDVVVSTAYVGPNTPVTPSLPAPNSLQVSPGQN